METLAKLTSTVLAKAAAARTPNVPSLVPGARPPLLDKVADYDIPARVWSNWKEDGKPRAIRRALTGEERSAVQRRAVELENGLVAFTPDEIDLVESAIDGMFVGFRSMRSLGEAATAETEVTRAVLREFPAWAIEQACLKIARNEAPELDPKWPPNDAQIHAVVAAIMKPYGEALSQARDMLAAPVEPPPAPKPTKAELEAKLGRPIAGRPPSGLLAPVDRWPPSDGKHGERVAAELAERRARREAGAA